ncbi:HipA N-terminal domain-containing protein, partial [Pseudomonas sp. GW460-13]|uniref:HipA N-terminal domain-containing protein n=1 Tax=Pseudomonas sp. GW460-13 TaxID=2070590 RepID=UPI0021144D24
MRGEKVRSYFDNLLPDSLTIRQRIARRFQARTTEAFDLLAQIGRDCVGALQILPDETVPAGVQRVEAQPLSEREVAQILRATVAPPPPGGVPD